MKSCLAILFLFLSTMVSANETTLNEEVWIDGNSFYKSINHKKQSTIYFSKWSGYVEQFLNDENYYVAIQLGEAFDPLPTDGITLPSLSTIAAVGDKLIREDYYSFLESFGRTSGINYMILPDTAGFDTFQKEILVELNANSPYYFLSLNALSFDIPESRKEFEAESAHKPVIWIADQEVNTRKINKWRNKLKRNQDGFYSELKKAKSNDFIPVYELPSTLKKSLFSNGIVAIDPHHQLPLIDKTISYLGSDPVLQERLSQYVNIIPYRLDGIPTIVDNRNQIHSVLSGDIVLQSAGTPIISAALVLPEVSIEHEDIVIAQALFGARGINGRSDHPFSRRLADKRFLGYANPEWEGINSDYLQWMDSLAIDAIQKYATPGMQLAVVKNGSVILKKAYGFYTYDSLKEVSTETLYDIASLTKVVATLPAIALLVDQGKIGLDDSLSMHLKEFSKSNKAQVTIRQLLSHNAGLLSYVPFWSMMMAGDRLDAFYYKTPEDEANDIRTYGLEPHPNMLDSLKSYIVRSRLIKNPEAYHYSDLGFMILHLLVEEVSDQPFDHFVYSNFFEPMELFSTMFNPKDRGLSFENITPTEYDHRYRNYQVWGEVHDRNALVFGGVAGHAGLFSNATDLAKMMSLFLNKGYFGGKRYLSEETVELFNNRYFEDNRRGLGWDKKDGKKDSASDYASDLSFGHTGFTGTMVWADPKEDLIFVFLSNRIYPDANNWKLGELNTRTYLHDVIYQSLEKGDL